MVRYTNTIQDNIRNMGRPFLPSSLISRMSNLNESLLPYLQDRVKREVPSVMSAINYRASRLSDVDFERSEKYLSLNAFPELPKEYQLACYSIIEEAEHLRELKKHIAMNQRYTETEPVFVNQELHDAICYDNELVNYNVIHRLKDTNIAKISNIFYRIDSRIPLVFYHWLEDCFKDSIKAVHICPNEVYNNQPPQMIVECVIQPPKHEWWNTLNIYNGTSTGCSLILLGNDDSNVQDYHDYNTLGIRKLQVSAVRDNAEHRDEGNLKMTIEELTKIFVYNNPQKAFMIGRMIHLDTDAKRGTSFKDAVLNHIDLAENLYVGDDAFQRDNDNLSNGRMVQKATYRTHLLRVNGIPFESIFKFAYAFFKSKQLVDEWKAAEFV